LIEEGGYKAAKLASLGWFYTTPGLTDERMHAFVATGLTHVGQELQADERIVVEHVPVAEALRMADSGELLDGKSIVALLLAHRRGLLGD
jgi:ADP-ribose pyrophosphatase